MVLQLHAVSRPRSLGLEQLTLPPVPHLPPGELNALVTQFGENPAQITAAQLTTLGRELAAGRLSESQLESVRRGLVRSTSEQLFQLADSIGQVAHRPGEQLAPGLSMTLTQLAERIVPSLGADTFEERDQAHRALGQMGIRALPALLAVATRNPPADIEVRRRAEQLTEQSGSEHGRFLAIQLSTGNHTQRTEVLRELTAWRRLVRGESASSPPTGESFLTSLQQAYERTLFQHLVSGLSGERPELQGWARQHLEDIGGPGTQIRHLLMGAEQHGSTGAREIGRRMITELLRGYLAADESGRNRLFSDIIRCPIDTLQDCMFNLYHSLPRDHNGRPVLMQLIHDVAGRSLNTNRAMIP